MFDCVVYTIPSMPPREEAPTPSSACNADANHCCLPDGRVVVPGGCQPVNRAGEHAHVRRGDDGQCVQIECLVRCLPATALIATPSGPVAVAQLREGDSVYTIDRGERVARPLLRVESVPLQAPHTLLTVTLADGRTTRASAGHPASDDRALGSMRVGDTLDGARIVGIEVVPYDGAATWDLLPASDTGAYFADGVLLGSTLRPN